MRTQRVIASVIVGITTAACTAALHAQTAHHQVTPLERIPSEKWVQVLHGDPGSEGAPFVMRIQTDPGYVVVPHTHAGDEHIVVLKGTWSLAAGERYEPADLEPLEVGDYAFVPARMPHYGRSETEIVVQVHGLAPFSVDFLAPVYELSAAGVAVMHRFGYPEPVSGSVPDTCFSYDVGDRVRHGLGTGVVVGAHCSPSNELTQYWVEKRDGSRFWAASEELERR